MKHSFTQNDLIRYLYNETSTEERLALEEVLQEDYALNMKYQELAGGYQLLPKVTYRPKLSSIDKILKYSIKQVEPISV